MTYPAAEAIQESFARDGRFIPDLEAEFAEVLLWYGGFWNPNSEHPERMQLLPYEIEDLQVIFAKMESARAQKDFSTSDTLREVLRRAGCVVKNQK